MLTAAGWREAYPAAVHASAVLIKHDYVNTFSQFVSSIQLLKSLVTSNSSVDLNNDLLIMQMEAKTKILWKKNQPDFTWQLNPRKNYK